MDDSTTGGGAVNTGDSNESLPANSTGQSAEQHEDTTSGGNSQGNGTSTDDSSNGEQSNTEHDEGLEKFAKSQGIENLDDLSDRERSLLKSAHDSQKEFHKKRQEDAGSLRDTVTELIDPALVADDQDSPEVKERKEMRAELAQLKQYQKANEFWRQNPDAKEYEADMIRLINEEKKLYGVESAYHLSRNMDRLYKLAKADRQDPDTLKEAGRREAREELRRNQEGSADSGSSTIPSSSRSNGKVDANWIDNVYDPSNAEHRKMLDAYLAGN